MTHTFATLEISSEAYDEIATRLHEAGYEHAFVSDGEKEAIDMHGIGLVCGPSDGSACLGKAQSEIEKMLSITPADEFERGFDAGLYRVCSLMVWTVVKPPVGMVRITRK